MGWRNAAKNIYAMGARFAKWRAVLTIDEAKGLPSALALAENANAVGEVRERVSIARFGADR